MKKSKLSEKGARMPDIRQPELEARLQEYIQSTAGLNTESARSQRFTILLDRLFGLQPRFIEEYLEGVERYVSTKKKDVVLRGRADDLFGNVIIEFERDLNIPGRLQEAQTQLRRYTACLWSEEPPEQRVQYICLASDGLRFIAYTPILDDPSRQDVEPAHITLHQVDEMDLRRLEHLMDGYFWLDRYLLRREILQPKSENIVKDFGLNSHAFQVAFQQLLHTWSEHKNEPEFLVIYEAWDKYLRLVYGSALGDDALFVRHTYLAVLAKLMVWMRLVEPGHTASDADIQKILDGDVFVEQGIENFLEEDFFSWPARPGARPTGIEIARRLLGLLKNYNLRELSEDVLKSLYEELVDPETRHDLGEYYTPDWLAARIVRHMLAGNPHASVLDPSCGSGTFLYQAIHEKRRHLPSTTETLNEILKTVVGMDIHPLAVIVAKTNYILALGDILQRRHSRIAIPVYLANAVQLPEFQRTPEMAIVANRFSALPPGYAVELGDQTVTLPETLVDQPALYDQAVEAARLFAEHWADEQPTREHFANFLRQQVPALQQDDTLTDALFYIAETLRSLICRRRDSIWAFVLKNSYRPLFLRGRFDLVVGNPPWLSYRFVEQLDYQRFLKRQITEEYGLLSGRGELITQMELGTLFLVRTAHLYLKTGGRIAFVLPRSIFTSDQHDALRRRAFRTPSLRWTELWDLEQVSPLFNVPACVLFGERVPTAVEAAQRQALEEPVPGQVLAGTLPRRNAGLEQAETALHIQEVPFFLNRRGKRTYWAAVRGPAGKISPYRELFRNGASIYPRAFWFVEPAPSPLGMDPELPPLVSSRRAQEEAKDAYRGLVIQGNVERRFLYATLLSTDLLPFGHLDFRMVVLPIEPAGDRYRLLNPDEARRRGFIHLARWLERVQAEWEQRRGAKAGVMNSLEWLDYQHKLTSQNPSAPFRVVYNAAGSYVCSCVVSIQSVVSAPTPILLNGFVVDTKMFYMETDNQDETQYICSVLNSPLVTQLVIPMQSRGQWGPRDIHKKVLDLPIPAYDPGDGRHCRLAELGRACAAHVADWLAQGGPGSTRSIGRLRSTVRELLKEELADIDALVRDILGMTEE